MYLKSIRGDVLFEGRFHTIKNAVEAAIKEKICLDGINLRHANLTNAVLDGASLRGACLWGANLESADLTGAQLDSSDCRNADFKDCCLAEANCCHVDVRGSYFSRTILRAADLSDIKFSCPSLFSLDLREVKSLKGAIYSHRGEIDCDFSTAPIIIYGLPKTIVLMNENLLIGASLYKADRYADVFSTFQNVISCEKALKEKALS